MKNTKLIKLHLWNDEQHIKYFQCDIMIMLTCKLLLNISKWSQ